MKERKMVCALAGLMVWACVAIGETEAPAAISSDFQKLAERLVIRRERGEWDKALELLLKMKETHPTHPAAWYGLGEIYGSDGPLFNRKEALAHLEGFLDLATDDSQRELRMKVQGWVLDLEDGKNLPALGGARGAAPGGAALSAADELEWKTIEQIVADVERESDADRKGEKQQELLTRVKTFTGKNADYLPGWLVQAGIAIDCGMPLDGYRAALNIQRLQAAGQTHAQALDVLAALNRNGWLEDQEPKVTGELKEPITIDLGKGVKMEFVWVPAGQFLMGSSYRHMYQGRVISDDERPVHLVEITKGFYMGKYEVTQEQYERLTGSNPSSFKGDRNKTLPVEGVNWNDAKGFCAKLTAQMKANGWVARLPTEAEWEYACRAMSVEEYNQPLDRAGWYDGNAEKRTHEVGKLLPNAWGLYDMHGNVWEWCADWYSGSYYRNSPRKDPAGASSGSARVLRGGSWYTNADVCRSANRGRDGPTYRDSNGGFRVVLSR